MPALSSSMVATVTDNCPHALDLQEDGAPRDGQVFEAGTSAHAVLEVIRREIMHDGFQVRPERARTLAAETVAALVLYGREFRGRREPPISLARATEGADIALRSLERDGWQLSPNAWPEVELAVTARWQPCHPNDPRAVWRGILDLVDLRETEEGEIALVVEDAKSSWHANEADCDSVQLRGQLLLAIAHFERMYPGETFPDVGHRVIHNLRTGQRHTLETRLDSDDLDLWREQILALVKAVPRRPPEGRPAMPGPHCAGCVYRRSCKAADPDATDPEQTAARWASLQAQADALAPVVKAAAKHHPVTFQDRVYTSTLQQTRTPNPEAAQELLALFPTDRTQELVRHLLSVGGLEAVAKAVHPTDPIAREEALSRWLTLTPKPKWAWIPKESP